MDELVLAVNELVSVVERVWWALIGVQFMLLLVTVWLGMIHGGLPRK